MSDAVSESGKKKSHGCLKALGVVAAVVVVAIVALVLALSKKEELGTLTWPTSELAGQLPVPSWAEVDDETGAATLEGELSSESEAYLSCYVAASEDEYAEYVAACEDAGFVVDYYRGSGSYSALNEAGYELSLRYYDEDDSSYEVAVMHVVLYAPDEEDEAEETDDEDAEDVTADDAAAEDAAADDADAVGDTADDAAGSSSDDTTDTSEVDPELAAWLDAYEAFMDSYVDFMHEYADADGADAAAMLADYAQMMAEYAELAAELEEWDTDEMSAADLAYYLEVTARVEARLLELYE